jgi:hypothetical protein
MIKKIQEASCLVCPLLLITTGIWQAFSADSILAKILIPIPFLIVGGIPTAIILSLMWKDFKNRKNKLNK